MTKTYETMTPAERRKAFSDYAKIDPKKHGVVDYSKEKGAAKGKSTEAKPKGR